MTSSVNEFRPASVTRVKRTLIDSDSKRTPSGSSPPSTVDGRQVHSPSKRLQVDNVTPLNALTDEHQRPKSYFHVNSASAGKSTSPSVSLVTAIQEQEPENQEQHQRINAIATPMNEFRPASVSRVKRSSAKPPSKQIHNESSTLSTAGDGHLESVLKHHQIENLILLDAVTDEHRRSESKVHVSSASAASKSISPSFSFIKNLDEKDQEDQKQRTKAVITPIKEFKPPSITRVTRIPSGKNSSPSTVAGTPLSSPLKELQAKDLIRLDTLTNKYRQPKQDFQSNSATAMKYTDRSLNLETRIEKKREEVQEQNRRTVSAFDWTLCRCFELLGCLFVMTACSIGIAALFFAISSYRVSLATFTTNSMNAATNSTISTSTTSTSTSSSTSTSTTSTTTTSTSSSTTSTTSTSATTMCSTTQMTTVITPSLPSQCSTYLSINDGTRLASSSTTNNSCDNTLFSSPQWVRFTGASGVSLANCPVTTYRCGTESTGWYSGIYPAIAGNTTTGTVCYTWASDTCTWQSIISVTNCNGYYVYELSSPPTCNARYCTM